MTGRVRIHYVVRVDRPQGPKTKDQRKNPRNQNSKITPPIACADKFVPRLGSDKSMLRDT